MKKEQNYILGTILRYSLLILAGISNIWIFYFIFTPLTIYPVNFLLGAMFGSSLTGNVITVANSFPIELIDACIAGSAYYLLLIFNLSTPNINFKKRTAMLGLALVSFLILNILRIIFLSYLFISGSTWLDATHKIFWYFLSMIFIIGIWFTEVKIFKVEGIPFYSDLKGLYKKVK